MMQVSEELTSTENKIAFARQAFNDQVMNYNTYRQSFPQIIIAGGLGHRSDAELLEFADSNAIHEAPSISFNPAKKVAANGFLSIPGYRKKEHETLSSAIQSSRLITHPTFKSNDFRAY